jgi:hypothetical protein
MPVLVSFYFWLVLLFSAASPEVPPERAAQASPTLLSNPLTKFCFGGCPKMNLKYR